MGLLKQLKEFEKRYLKGEIDNSNIAEHFESLAGHMLYGGYIDVYGIFKIYIRIVEFYFHEESTEGKIRDCIVYHRNGKVSPNLPTPPFFPTMSLHAHMSGLDITFESEKGNYRGSALIRGYSVYDKSGNPIVEDATQSTYLYNYLNGFSLKERSSIRWIDKKCKVSTEALRAHKRRNVFLYNGNGEKTDEQDTRKWSFTATDPIK